MNRIPTASPFTSAMPSRPVQLAGIAMLTNVTQYTLAAITKCPTPITIDRSRLSAGSTSRTALTVVAMSRLPQREVHDVPARIARNRHLGDLRRGDLRGQARDVVFTSIDQIPVHDRFHVADVAKLRRKVADEQEPTGS